MSLEYLVILEYPVISESKEGTKEYCGVSKCSGVNLKEILSGKNNSVILASTKMVTVMDENTCNIFKCRSCSHTQMHTPTLEDIKMTTHCFENW